MIKIPITLGYESSGITKWCWATVINNLGFDFITGTDFLHATKSHIDFEFKLIHFKHKSRRVSIAFDVHDGPIKEITKASMHLVLMEQTTINFGEEIRHVPVRLHKNNPWRNSDLLVEVDSDPVCSMQRNVHSAKGPLDLKNGRGRIQLTFWNINAKQITLPAGTIVAKATPIVDDDNCYINPNNIDEGLDIMEDKGRYFFVKNDKLHYVIDSRPQKKRLSSPLSVFNEASNVDVSRLRNDSSQPVEFVMDEMEGTLDLSPDSSTRNSLQIPLRHFTGSAGYA